MQLAAQQSCMASAGQAWARRTMLVAPLSETSLTTHVQVVHRAGLAAHDRQRLCRRCCHDLLWGGAGQDHTGSDHLAAGDASAYLRLQCLPCH